MYRHGGSGEGLRVPRPHKRPVLPPAAALHGHHLPTHYCCHKNGRPQRSVRDNIFIFIHRCHYIPYCITFMNVSTFILPSLIGTLLTPLLSSPLFFSSSSRNASDRILVYCVRLRDICVGRHKRGRRERTRVHEAH